MAVHIGKEMERRFASSGLTKKAFASRIGRTPKNLYELFERPSIDTQVLKKASEALHFNFFKLYCEELDRLLGMTTVNEPDAVYHRSRPTVIVIQGDDSDPELLERITQAAKDPHASAPKRDKSQG